MHPYNFQTLIRKLLTETYNVSEDLFEESSDLTSITLKNLFPRQEHDSISSIIECNDSKSSFFDYFIYEELIGKIQGYSMIILF